MLEFYVFLLALNGLAYGQFRLCPPSCKLPESAEGCHTYFLQHSCTEDIIDLSMPEAHCACLWQTYIQNTEPAGTIIFTTDGRSCYSWAVKTCAYLDRETATSPLLQDNGISVAEEKTGVFGNNQFDHLIEQIKRLASTKDNNVPEKEVAKHRRRNGVENIPIGYTEQEGGKSSQHVSQPQEQHQQKQVSQPQQEQVSHPQQKQLSQPQHKEQQGSHPQHKQQQGHHPQPIVTGNEEQEVVQSFIGSVGQSKTGQWFVIEPEHAIPVKNCTAPIPKINIEIPVNQFKLGVFLLILLLNTLFVIVLIICRRSTPRKRQQKPAGDLDVSKQYPDPDVSQHESSEKSKRKQKQDVELLLPDTPEESPEKAKHNLLDLHFIDAWIKKIQEKRKKKKSKENKKKSTKEIKNLRFENCEDETGHCYTENRPTYYNADMFWPQKGNVSLGHYDELSEDLGSSDTMYEVAMPSPEDPNQPYVPKRYSVDFSSTDSSPTKYLPRSPDKRFHFAVPPGTYVTLQDRVDGSTNTENVEENQERPRDDKPDTSETHK